MTVAHRALPSTRSPGRRAGTLRVLYVIDSLAPGGAERSLASLAPPLMARGIDLTVSYLRARPGLQEELRRGGAAVVDLSGPGGRAGNALRVARLIRRLGPHLVHTTLYEADVAGRVAARLTGVPVVSTLPGELYDPEHFGDPTLVAWRLRAARLADRLTARLVTRFHAVTESVASVMSAALGVPRDLIEVIPRGRDPEELGARSPERTAATRAKLGLDPGDRLIVCVARHEHKKGLDVLARAMAEVRREVPEARLLVAGREGSQTGRLRDLVRDLGVEDRVSFLGVRGDVPDLVAAADVFVLPSVSEGFPGALVEAMALQAPAVATDLPGVREALGREGGVLVPPRDPRALGRAVVSVLRDPQAGAARAALARRRFLSRFSIQAVAEQMVGFYARALQAASSGRPAGGPGRGGGRGVRSR